LKKTSHVLCPRHDLMSVPPNNSRSTWTHQFNFIKHHQISSLKTN